MLVVGLQPTAAEPDPHAFLPPLDELPAGFEHQPKYDRVMTEEPGTVRAFRFFTRGAPQVATDEHASILLVVSVGESSERAAVEFSDAVTSWTRMGYDLAPLEGAIGDIAVAGWDVFFAGTDHPKEGALLHFRAGAVNATVQWTDDPGAITLEHVLAIARLIETRCDRAASAFRNRVDS
jgi:hypothetical protein